MLIHIAWESYILETDKKGLFNFFLDLLKVQFDCPTNGKPGENLTSQTKIRNNLIFHTIRWN